ncbi:MAG TPA: hypothetical protein VFQ61_13220 [Polyangiaceae bacterium]|nr:hypothetical protein [Polyangiaceae bacterium]
MSPNTTGLYYEDCSLLRETPRREIERTEQIGMHLGAPMVRVLGANVLVLALALGGCRTSEDDVHRWANTVQGPRKLLAVLVHQKYPVELRVEAAATLISMKPRSGRRIGIQGSEDQPGLMDALAQLPPAARNAIVSRLVPRLLAEMKKPPPVAQAGQPAPADPSVPYKDAAFSLLTHNSGSLLADASQNAALREALASWASTNFAERLDDSSQLFGVEQMMRELRADGVRSLPTLIAPGASKIDRIAELIADFGDPTTRMAASQKLVQVAKEVDSEAWINQKAPAVEAANRVSKITVTKERFRKQLEQYQEEELLRVFTSMKKVGGKPVADYLLQFAQDKSRGEKRRAAAMAALQGNLDRNNPAHAEAVLTIAQAADTPDQLRDAAFARVGEFPRQMILSKLYGLFRNENWKVRWVAAELVLKTIETSDLPEFFKQLGQVGKGDGFAITEPLRYGALIANMKGPPVREIVDKYAGTQHPVPVRMTALGYYFEAGSAADLPKIQPYEKDAAKAPTCREGAKECEWKCEVVSGGSRETKDISTVGDFVSYCIKPAMESRAKK